MNRGTTTESGTGTDVRMQSVALPATFTVVQLIASELTPAATVSPAVLACLTGTLSPNTWLAYRGDVAAFLRWGGKLPASSDAVAEFAAACAATQTPATIRRRVAGLAAAHIRAGLPDPTKTTLVRAVLRGIQRQAERPQRQADPLLPPHLASMLKHMQGLRGDRDRALLFLGFAGALRRSELVALDVADLHFFDGGVRLEVRKSKTDQYAHGRSIIIPVGRDLTCPVAAAQLWLALSGIRDGPLFVSLTSGSPKHGGRLAAQTVATVIKHYVRLIGLVPETYSGHSLRSGWITAVAALGASDHEIRQHTGHMTAQMVTRYIRFATSSPHRTWSLL